MKKLIFAYIFLIIAIIIAAVLKSGNITPNPNSSPSITINNKKINLILAKTQSEKEIGLSNKQNLDKDTGMLFIFAKKDYPSFWMRNMKFPIDIIFIDDNKIVDMYQNAQPAKNETNAPVYKPKNKANYVLEMNANTARENNFKIGDKVSINIPK